MKVDRKGFLRFVAVIAGAGTACGTKQEPHAVLMLPVESRGDAGVPIASDTIASPPPRSDLAPEPMSSGGIWSLSYDPSAKPLACSDLKCPSPTHEAMGALQSACRTIQKRLSAETFQRFMTCMMARNNTTDTCDLRRVSVRPDDCLTGWTETPTIDPGTAAKCKSIVAACGGPNRSVHARSGISMDDCQKIMSVTNAKSEKTMIHCVTEYCSEALDLCHGGYG